MSEVKQEQGPKYFISIEGQEFPWDQNTITTEQIADLGGWDISQGVIEVDQHNNERTLQPDEVIEIKPGHGFGKKHRWKRGYVRTRIADELVLLQQNWSDVEHIHADGEDWFRITHYPMPPGWHIGNETVGEIPVVFPVTAAHPGAPPYGFLAPAGLNFNGTVPKNTGAAPKVPPFEGNWMQFSWSPEDWTAADDVHKGSNLLAWSRSFGHRFREGV